MVEETEVKPKAKKPRAQMYQNTTRLINVFTSKGRCMPGEKVSLMDDEAKQYDGKLTRC